MDADLAADIFDPLLLLIAKFADLGIDSVILDHDLVDQLKKAMPRVVMPIRGTLGQNVSSPEDNELRDHHRRYWNLQYRASTDGFDPYTFHSMCDNSGDVIVVVSIEGSQVVCGGYTAAGFMSNMVGMRDLEFYPVEHGYVQDYHAFVFSRRAACQQLLVYPAKRHTGSIHVLWSLDSGPVFGHALRLQCDEGQFQRGYSNKCTFFDGAGSGDFCLAEKSEFIVADIEVFSFGRQYYDSAS